METIIRTRAFFLFILFTFGFTSIVRTDSKRTVKITRGEIADRLEQSAERWLHVRELTGNNDHPWIAKSMNLVGLDGDKGYAWCASAQADIHHKAEVNAPMSARVVDWFKKNVVWKKEFGEIPPYTKRGMVGGLYYRRLGRLGHIFLIVGEDKNNYYTLEGNTNQAGSREGDGFYRKIRSKKSVSALADYCLAGNLFAEEYGTYLNSRK